MACWLAVNILIFFSPTILALRSIDTYFFLNAEIPMGLDDDPLSITANVASILTFIAAVLAFVYVRYNTIRNGHKEMTAILESVFATIEETRAMAMMTSEPEKDQAAEVNIPQKLLADLYALEMGIIVEFMYAYGNKLSNRLRNLHSSSFQESATWTK